MNKYLLGRCLGKGTDGQVYQAQNEEKRKFAVKLLHGVVDSLDGVRNIPEVKAANKLFHANIVTTVEIVRKQGRVYLVQQLLQGSLLQELKLGQLSLMRVRNVLFQLLQALHYMHGQGFIHRDLKPENVFSNGEEVKLGDFGLCAEAGKGALTEYVSTRWYRAPEVLLGSPKYDEKIDIFSLGCVFGEMLLGEPIFPGTSTKDQLHRIMSVLGTPTPAVWPEGYELLQKLGIRLPFYAGRSLIKLVPRLRPEAQQLLEKMLSLNPQRRPSAKECLENQFFSTDRLYEEGEQLHQRIIKAGDKFSLC